MERLARHYREVWVADFEFHAPNGERPKPICMVVRELIGGRIMRLWSDDLAGLVRPPFAIGNDSLFVAYYASAELGCFLALDWPMPARILDLFCEFRNATNGLPTPCGAGLLGALTHYGLDAMGAAEKDSMRDLAIRGGPFTDDERTALLDYCQSDVDSLARLLPAMLPSIDLPRALLRGRYMAAAARMEWGGVPIDTLTLDRLRRHWLPIQSRLIAEVDKDYHVYVPTGRTLDPDSTLGAAILDAAADYQVDAFLLADAVDTVWHGDRNAVISQQSALSAARRDTGLTAAVISRWEESGKDYSTYPDLDVKARELAGQYPELGIGSGYLDGAGHDDTDYAAALWDLLREGSRPVPPRHDPDLIRRAAAMLESCEPGIVTGRMSFSSKRWADWLRDNGIPWPHLPTGGLDLKDETFRQMARRYSEVAPIRELRHTLSELRLNDLAVGQDGRNRTLLSAFRARTGRNQPSNSRFIFGPSCWLRGLIQPEQGRAVAYVDWEQQEYGIGAVLSGDKAMMHAYASGDPYLAFAKQAGAVPPDATKQSHPAVRDQCKICLLAVMYRMGAQSLAQSLGQSEAAARHLLDLHRQTYPRFWRWSESAVNHAMLRGWLRTVFGWRILVGVETKPRTLANFPSQGNGGEMLRLACCLLTEAGIRVCAPIHDAVLVEAGADEIDAVVQQTQAIMAEASKIVLDGFALRTEASIVRWPDRYQDKRGVKMWQVIMGILDELERDYDQFSEWVESAVLSDRF